MHFLFPSFLWALVALSIPIIVHLFNFRRAKLIQFSNVRFLESVKKQSSSKKRLKHLLILASRLLFILFLVLAFAQPYIPGEKAGLSASNLTIYLDNSQSMSNISGNEQASLTAGINLIENVIQLYPEHTRVKLISNDFSAVSNNFRNKNFVEDDLLEIGYSSVTRNGKDIMAKIHPGTGDVFFISDFQSSAFDAVHSTEDTVRQYHIVRIPQNEEQNISVDSIYLKRPFVIPGQRNQTVVRMKNHADQKKEDLIVRLFLNERQNASVSVDIAANEYIDINFELEKDLSAINRGRISFEDYPIVFDNDHHFVIRAAQSINVVEVRDADINSPFIKLFERHDLFEFVTYTRSNINYEILSKADFLIFNGLAEITNGLTSQINEALAEGKSVLVIPHPEADGQEMSNSLGLPLSTYSTTDTLEIDVVDVKHPFFENIFEENEENNTKPNAQFIWKWDVLGDVLLRSSTNKPYLSHIPSRGKLYLTASPLSAPYTDLDRNSLFVPVLFRMAEQSSSTNQKLSHTINNSVVEVLLDSANGDGLYNLMSTDNEIIPEQRLNGNRLVMNLPSELMDAGYYDLVKEGQKITTLAFNHDKLESQPQTMTDGEIDQWFNKIPNKAFYSMNEPSEIIQNMKELYDKIELWKYALILSLVFLLAEALLIRLL